MDFNLLRLGVTSANPWISTVVLISKDNGGIASGGAFTRAHALAHRVPRLDAQRRPQRSCRYQLSAKSCRLPGSTSRGTGAPLGRTACNRRWPKRAPRPMGT